MPPLIGVDYGRRRVGTAISDPDRKVALPLEVIHVNGLRDAVHSLLDLCAGRGVRECVVGWPLNMNGTEGEMTQEVAEFVERLKRRGLSVILSDERLTSYGAEQSLIEAGVKHRRRRQWVDKLAAREILQRHLDELNGTETVP